MSPCGTDGQTTTSEDRATQLEALSLAMKIQLANSLSKIVELQKLLLDTIKCKKISWPGEYGNQLLPIFHRNERQKQIM